MKQLEELESKVLQIVDLNRALKSKNDFLEDENRELKAKCDRLEDSMLVKDKFSQDLEGEKEVIKASVKELLDSIGSLEEKNKEMIK